jgi:hypothetical protein
MNLLGKKFDSKCCNGKEATVVLYDHTGAILTECECGKKYWHDLGVHHSEMIDPNFNNLPRIKR